MKRGPSEHVLEIVMKETICFQALFAGHSPASKFFENWEQNKNQDKTNKKNQKSKELMQTLQKQSSYFCEIIH